jgi:carboxymethylenebutenolidase
MKVIEEAAEISTADGKSDAFIYRADDGSRRPGVIVLTDIGGVRDASRAMARRIAEAGYTTLLPNVFYRNAKPPVIDFPRKPGDERLTKRIAEMGAPLTPEAMDRDATAYVDFLAEQPFVSAGPIGVVGHCFTGGMAVRVAAARPEKVAAAASFHGGRLYTDEPSSPHLVLPRVKARLYFAHAVQDRSMSEEAIKKLGDALRSWGGKYDSEVYEGAYHSWTATDSLVYNREQAEHAFRKLMDLFSETLQRARAA